MVGIGSIIYVRNIIFKDATKPFEQVDHAFLSGRPCLVVDFDRDYLYFFPITHVKEAREYRNKYIFDETLCLWGKRKYDKHAVTTHYYYKIPFSQMYVHGTLDPYALAEVMECYCYNHQKCHNTLFYQNLSYYCDVLKQIGSLSEEKEKNGSLNPYNLIEERYDFLSDFNEYLYDEIFPSKSLMKTR